MRRLLENHSHHLISTLRGSSSRKASLKLLQQLMWHFADVAGEAHLQHAML